MSHLPVNHHLRTVYRVVAGLCGLYVLVLGIAGFGRAAQATFFARDGVPWTLGLPVNRAFAMLSIVAGATILVGAVLGRNVARWVNLVGGTVFLTAGLVTMMVLRTSLNPFGFTMTTCIVSFLLGLVLLSAGLYGQVGPLPRMPRSSTVEHG